MGEGLLKNENKIFGIGTDNDFRDRCLEVFRYQYAHNPVYRKWVSLLNIDPLGIAEIEKIPFLPIEFFKSQRVLSGPENKNAICFTSSATTSQTPARHFVSDVLLYEASFLQCFNLFYGDPGAYCILALLPNYLERSGSSLVYMCKELITRSGHPSSGFYLKNIAELKKTISGLKQTRQRVLLLGVSYALMDLADEGVTLNENFIVMETGGMKGTRKEMLKPELHAYLKSGFKINTIHSEYGMTELLSQAYSNESGLFTSPPWMRFYIREVDDPLKLRHDHKTGGINVIDLANIYSCSFIATKDLGRLTEDGKLELMGRYDHSDVRGCNLMLGNF